MIAYPSLSISSFHSSILATMSLRETPSQAADSQKEKKSQDEYRDPPNEADSEQLNTSELIFSNNLLHTPSNFIHDLTINLLAT